MEFRILGPLEVRANGKVLEVGAHKQRVLLAVLVLEANRVVSSDRLIDALWEDAPPATAVKALQLYVSQLRQLLGKERVLTKPPGYLLRVECDELDLERFQRLREEGRLREALSLWRGGPLSDLAYERFAQDDIARLEELRLVCLEERIGHDLEDGRHAELVGELEALVKEHPFRERPRAQLMLALYRSGRQAEALGAYQQARSTLVEELGIEPGRQLRELHHAILRQDANLDLELPVESREERQAPVAESAVREPSAREVRKTVSAVHIVVGISSERGEGIDPEALRRMTSRAFREIQESVGRHGAAIETVTGDAVTAVFGLPVVHEDDALRAVRAAAELRERLQVLAGELLGERGARLAFSVGVGTGEVVTGGEAEALLRATGEPLTVASRLARAAEPDEVVLDDATRRLVRGAVVVEPVADESFRFVRVAEAPPRQTSRFTSPMVGRERERRRLQDAFEQAVGDRSCQLFTVLGGAGVGKSRLVQEFAAGVGAEALVTSGRCLPYGEGITFWPLLEAVRGAVGLDDTDSPGEAVERLARVLEERGSADLLARRAAETIGLAEGNGGGEEGFASICLLFDALAQRQPVVLVFDDIHWGEPTFLDLVDHLAEWIRDAPVLLVCLARPELLEVRPGWGGGKLNATTVLLEPLSEEECDELIGNLVGRAELPAQVESRIAEAAEGNPLFVEEMISMLVDDGLLRQEDGRWTAAGDLTAVPVPPTIRALLAARLDRLDDEERAVIERASVEGKVFHHGSLEVLARDSFRPSVARHLGTLVRKELIRPEKPVFAGEDAFRFRHLLVRDAAYDSIPKQIRADLHDRHAGWLEGKAGERAVEYDEIIGYHLEQACRYRAELGPIGEEVQALGRRAAERLGAAARRAFARSDAPAATNLASRAVSLLPPGDPLRVDLVPNVRAIQGLSDFAWAEALLDDAVAAGDRRLRAHALVQRAFLRLFTAREVNPQQFIAIAEQAIATFEELDDVLGLARAWRLMAQAHYLDRHGGPSAEAAERALAYARRTGDRFEQREILEWLVVALFLGPVPAGEAARRCEKLLEVANADRVLELNVVGALASLMAIQGRTAEARELVEREHGDMHEVRDIWLFRPPLAGLIGLWVSDPATAEQELRPLYEQYKRVGAKSHFSSVAPLLAQAVYAQGRFDAAEELVREAELAARPNDVHSQIVWRGTMAKILARHGDFEAAERLGREAVEFARQSDFLDSRGVVLADLAEVLRLAGRSDEAADALREALLAHEQKQNVLAAEHVRTLLAELSS
jgi:DNA-binding SARP family transcriptional activator/tetratricopeptide (TPR) repeat protein